MTKDQQFTCSIRHLQSMAHEDLELFCKGLLPGIVFKFVSFENNDYSNGNVTCYLYSSVPESVFFSVETALEIEPALEKLVELNSGVEWYWAALTYIDYDKSGHARMLIELRLVHIPMRVSASGNLIFK